MMQALQTVNGHSPRSATAKAARPRTTCPVCSSAAHTDKVSNIVRSGRGKLIFLNGEVARYETELAELLDEPPRPLDIPVRRAVLCALPPLLVLAGILVALPLIQGQPYLAVPAPATEVAQKIGIAWFGVLIPGVAILRYTQTRAELARDLPAWTLARRRWTALFYCSRDDVVFSPILNASASPEEIGGMLYAGTGSAAQRAPGHPGASAGGTIKKLTLVGIVLVVLGASLASLSDAGTAAVKSEQTQGVEPATTGELPARSNP